MNFATATQGRSLAFPGALIALATASLWFYYRQNFAGQIGGEMSVAKLLWLDYTLLAWFMVPFFVWRSPLTSLALRQIYGAHLVNFLIRGAAELWMLYVSISWLPPYGIAHDLFSIGLITALLWRQRWSGETKKNQNSAAHRFLISIRAGLVCEMAFAWLFYRATDGRIGIYFASDDPHFAFINNLTWFIVVLAYTDLIQFVWRARGILFVIAAGTSLGKAERFYEGTSG